MLSRTNKHAYFDYEIIQTWETGIVLHGHEVKSIKQKRFSCGETVVRHTSNTLILINMNVDAYSHTGKALLHGYQPSRPRTLLLHISELRKIAGILSHGGTSLVLTKIYSKGGRIKCEIGLGKKKKKIEKKQIIKERETDRAAKKEIKALGL